ncbi:MAG: T9SS type A sorting domain-containing protein [Saprospiraceae bacterium]|nr:T9SS type A sorting domain-containing protein [Saprospiraceae bacterium]
MRYKVSSFLIFLWLFQYSANRLYAQTEWYKQDEFFYYEVTTGWDFENYGIHSLTYFKDTVINGFSLKTLRYTDKRGNHSDIFVNQEGEKVRHYRPFLNEFTLMYDFTAFPGDPSPVTGYTIETIGSIEIENTIRKTQTWKNGDKRVFVIEGIGMVGDPAFTSLRVCSPPVPFYGCTSAFDGYDYYFRCMKSKGVDFDPFGECAEVNTKEENVFSIIYPNPTYNAFTIKSSSLFDEYRIFDQTGKMVYKQTISPNVETGCHFEGGTSLYFIQIYHQNKLISTEKLVFLPTP